MTPQPAHRRALAVERIETMTKLAELKAERTRFVAKLEAEERSPVRSAAQVKRLRRIIERIDGEIGAAQVSP
jgi:acyl-CoA reductase-like NAD-dependent aldehyde dehydrogenase